MTDPVEQRIEQRIESAVRDNARRSFGPGFSDRVMRRVGEEADVAILVLPSQFLRLAAGVAATIVLLAGYSVFIAQPYDEQSAIEAVLGFEPEAATGQQGNFYELDPMTVFAETGQ